MMRILALSSFILLLAACGTSKRSQFTNTVESIITVNPEPIPCPHKPGWECLQIQQQGEPDWEIFQGEITHFQFEPGFYYTLKVWKEEITDAPAGEPDWRYVLIEELEKTPATASPLLRLHDIWVVTEMNGEPLSIDRPRPQLELFPGEGRLAGNGSCNQLFGQMTADEYHIQFERVGATKMYCNGLMDQENTFLQLLNKVDTYEIRHLQLILFVEGDVAMVLQKVD